MITADEARKLHKQEEGRKAAKAAEEKEAARVREIEYQRYLREEKFPEKLAEIESLIKDAIKDGKRNFFTKVGEDGTGRTLSELLVSALKKNGFGAAFTSEYTPEDNEVCASDGYYGHPSYTTYTLHVEW